MVDADGGTYPSMVGTGRMVEVHAMVFHWSTDDVFGLEIPSSCHERVGVFPDATQRNNGEHKGIPIGMGKIR